MTKQRLPHVTPRYLPPATPPRDDSLARDLLGFAAVVVIFIVLVVVLPVLR